MAETEFVVEAMYRGWRLDRYLQARLRHMARTKVQKIIEQCLIAERPLKASSRVYSGMRFVLRREVEQEPTTPQSFEELYLDDDLLVVNKPAGLPVHPSARYHHNTLIHLIRQRYGTGYAELAHRLDRETSGILVLARRKDIAQQLMRTFARGSAQKVYLALCEGWPDKESFVVDAPLALGTSAIRIAMRVDPSDGKPARTRFLVIDRFVLNNEHFSLVGAFPQTGRQHQIRAHLKCAGFPIVGDKIYGPDPLYYDRFTRHCLEPEAYQKLRLPRHALHAFRLSFPLYSTQQLRHFEAPWPPDLNGFYNPEKKWPDISEKLSNSIT